MIALLRAFFGAIMLCVVVVLYAILYFQEDP